MSPTGLLRSFALVGAIAVSGCSADTYGSGYSYGPAPASSYPYEPAPAPATADYPAPPADETAVQPPDVEGGVVDQTVFYDQLSPYGQWVDVRDYGRCWVPANVAAGWRPYTMGYWAYTGYGWTWVSYEPFGWATYHYGRWVIVPGHGWVWVPGRVWGPAWVAWRYGDGYCGWAPLPPTVGFSVSIGIGIHDHHIPSNWFSFVAERDICEPHVHSRILPIERNVTIINRTTNITNIHVENKRVVNVGVPVDRIERDTGRRIERVNVREVQRSNDVVKRATELRDSRTRDGEVAIFRPSGSFRSGAANTTERKVETRKVDRDTKAPATIVRPQRKDPDPKISQRTTPARPSTQSPVLVPQEKRTPAADRPVARNSEQRSADRKPTVVKTPTAPPVAERETRSRVLEKAPVAQRPAQPKTVEKAPVAQRPSQPKAVEKSPVTLNRPAARAEPKADVKARIPATAQREKVANSSPRKTEVATRGEREDRNESFRGNEARRSEK